MRLIAIIAGFAFCAQLFASDDSFLTDIAATVPWLGYALMALGTLVVVAQAVVVITPTKKDDEFLKKSIVSKLIDILSNFAPIKKK